MYRLSSRRKKRLYSKLRKANRQSLSISWCDLSLRRDDKIAAHLYRATSKDPSFVRMTKNENNTTEKIRTNPRFRSSESVSSACHLAILKKEKSQTPIKKLEFGILKYYNLKLMVSKSKPMAYYSTMYFEILLVFSSCLNL